MNCKSILSPRARFHLAVLGLAVLPLCGQTVLVAQNSALRYKANSTDPGLALTWTAESFNDAGWTAGSYGIGYENAPPGATALLQTTVQVGTLSVYTRSTFSIADVNAVGALLIGADYDDGVVAWINGVEVWRASMPAGAPAWNTDATLHESSNGATPNYGVPTDITATGKPALHNGTNVLAIGVWNSGGAASSDLVLVPQLSYTPAGVITVTRGPYLQRATPTAITVRWTTDAATDGRVRYGPVAGAPTNTADQSAIVQEHEVTLSGLTADTRYFYSVGTTTAPLTGGDASHYFVTSPPPDRARPLRFWALGDAGTGTAAQAAVRDAFYAWNGTRALDGILLLGDNAYTTGTLAQYQANLFAVYPAKFRNTTVWSAYGNHDSYSANSATQSGPYFDLFTFPRAAEAGGVASGTEAYYSFEIGNVHFVVLDSMTAAYRDPAGPMMTWLQQDLAASAGRDWLIALFHHPPYSKGSHNSDAEIELMEMRANYLPVLEQAGVDLMLCGHSHSYERSFLIDSHYGLSTTFTTAMKKDGGDGRPAGAGAYRKPTRSPAPHEGTVYAVPGSAGQISGGTLDHPAMFISLNRLGSFVLDVNGLRLDATFLDDGATPAALDSFTLFKGGPQPRAVPDGRFVAGTPMKVVKQGGDLAVNWDVAGCRSSAQYEILYGFGSGLAAYTLSGAVCDIGDRGTFSWTPPAPPGGQTLLWWWVVGTDGKSREGSWGLSGAGVEPVGSTVASGYCGTTAKNTANTCP